jgi:hypothetical protein
VLLWAAPALGAFEMNDASWEGGSALFDLARDKLGRDRVELRATLDWRELQPEDGLLVLHPEVTLDYDSAAAFLRAGGRMAIVDDHGRGDELLAKFQIRRIRAPLRPVRALRKNANLAIAVPAVQQAAGQEQGRHPVVAEVQQLVTNHPSTFVHPQLTPVLRIDAIDEPHATLAVTGIIAGRGRLFAMGDPSAMINLMLRYPGNRAFAIGLVQYLVEDDAWGKRSGKLYVVTNRFKQSGVFGGEGGAWADLVDQVRALAGLLDDAHEHGLPDALALVLGVLCAAGAAGWLGMVASRAYRRTPPRFAQPVPLAAQGGVAGRAAVLGAPSTHRALALLELKNALEEGLKHRLGLDPSTAAFTLRAEIDRQRALGERSSRDLEDLLVEMSRAEAAVVASQPLRVTERALERARQRVAAILADADERLGRRR